MDKWEELENIDNQYIIGLSKASIRDIANGYNDYDCYVKEIIEDPEALIDSKKIGFITTTDINEALKINDKYEASVYANRIKEDSDWRTVVSFIYTKESKKEAQTIVYETAQSIATKIKQYFESKYKDNFRCRIANIDGIVGLQIQRLHNEDLVSVSESVIKLLNKLGIRKDQYEIEFNKDSFIIALDNIQTSINM